MVPSLLTAQTHTITFEGFPARTSFGEGEVIDWARFACCSGGSSIVRTDDPGTAYFFGGSSAHSGIGALSIDIINGIDLFTPASVVQVYVLDGYEDMLADGVAIDAGDQNVVARVTILAPKGVWTLVELRSASANISSVSFGGWVPESGGTGRYQGAVFLIDDLSAFVTNGCGDERDAIIAEYTDPQYNNAAYAQGLIPFSRAPSCDMFTQAFPNFNVDNDSSWELVRAPLVAEQTGFAFWQQTYEAPLVVKSSYRTPKHNASIPGSARGSRHVFGDAIDVANEPGTSENWKALYEAAEWADADWLEGPHSTYPCRCDKTKCNCVHADWRNTPGTYVH